MLSTGTPIPKGVDVCHSCDVRNCVNPAHLWLGTRQENVDDMHMKGRALKARGEGASNAILTKDDVIKIRLLRQTGLTLKAIGAMFGVSIGCISAIEQKRNWAHVE